MKSVSACLRFAVIGLIAVGTISSGGQHGQLLDGEIADMAQDGAGRVWAIQKDRSNQIALLEGDRWVRRSVPSLSEFFKPTLLTRLSDGNVACLWQSGDDNRRRWVITRHLADQTSIWSEFEARLATPRMTGRADGSAVITERGRQVVMVPLDGKSPDIVLLGQECFVEPKKYDDGTTPTSYEEIHVVEDATHKLWLWSYGMKKDEYEWRLKGLVNFQDGQKRMILNMGEKDPPISAVIPWNPTDMAVAAGGEGFLTFPLTIEGRTTSRMKEPEEGVFQHIEQAFHDGTAWHVITLPRPPEHVTEVSPVIPRMLVSSTTYYHDFHQPVGRLWRYDGTVWHKLGDGLDEVPMFGRERSWIKTKKGLLISSPSNAPWLFPPGETGVKPYRLDADVRFPLQAPQTFFETRPGELIMRDIDGRTAFWNFDTPPQAGERRVHKLRSRGAVQDEKGNIWNLRADQTLVEWRDKGWVEHAKLDEALRFSDLDFVRDDRDRGWLIPDRNTSTAVCNFNTGKWEIFDTLQKALVAQLPEGVKIFTPEPSLTNPAFSGDGRIGIFLLDDEIMLFEKGAWRTWKFSEIAGNDARMEAAPFFSADGHFSIPVGADSWQWHSEKGWELHPIDPFAGARSDHEARNENVAAESGLGVVHSAVKDIFGATWYLTMGNELRKSVGGQSIAVLKSGEPSPLIKGASLFEVLTDRMGNALLRPTGYGIQSWPVFIQAEASLPLPPVLKLITADDTVNVAIIGNEGVDAFYSWRLDDGLWSDLAPVKDVKLAGLLPGEHKLDVRPYNEELTTLSLPVSVTFEIKPVSQSLLPVVVRRLSSDNLDELEDVARILRTQGDRAVPVLRAARPTANSKVQWWIDAIIQHIERESQLLR